MSSGSRFGCFFWLLETYRSTALVRFVVMALLCLSVLALAFESTDQVASKRNCSSEEKKPGFGLLRW